MDKYFEKMNRLKTLQKRIVTIRPYQTYPFTELHLNCLQLQFYGDIDNETGIFITLKFKREWKTNF
jgi:hypothetical protein